MNYFVTGGSRGIGATIVLQAVSEGHDVVFTYREREEQARAVAERAQAMRPGCRCLFFQLDVRNSEQVDRVGDVALDEMGCIEVVINNAGINRDNLLVNLSNEEWDDVLGTNLTGPFYVCRRFLPDMVANRFGRIINISSLSARGCSGQANYASSKSGLLGLTSTIAREYGRRGITANVVSPGWFETELSADSLSESNRKFWLTYCPLRRPGQGHELTRVITFLASEAGGFINGADIPVTGGLDWSP